jgi:hypothetical protein
MPWWRRTRHSRGLLDIPEGWRLAVLACSAFDHVGGEEVRELGQGSHVELQHVRDRVEGLVDKRAVPAVSAFRGASRAKECFFRGPSSS